MFNAYAICVDDMNEQANGWKWDRKKIIPINKHVVAVAYNEYDFGFSWAILSEKLFKC